MTDTNEMPMHLRQKSGEVRKAFEAFVIAAYDEASRHGYELDIARRRIKELEASRATLSANYEALSVKYAELQKQIEESKP